MPKKDIQKSELDFNLRIRFSLSKLMLKLSLVAAD